MGRGFKRLVFSGALLAVTALGLEFALQLLALAFDPVRLILASPWDASLAATVPDELLEVRPNPALRGHDRDGFRNPRVPQQADIVALGDSQTYGTGVAAQDTWPRELERRTGRITYSMAFGGYGPVHSLILLDRALRLAPDLVIEALYSGNDLYDSFRMAYLRESIPDLRGRDAEMLRAVLELERREPLAERVEAFRRSWTGARSPTRCRPMGIRTGSGTG